MLKGMEFIQKYLIFFRENIVGYRKYKIFVVFFRSTICHLAIMHHELRTILDNDERFDEEFISNIFKDVEDSNEFSITTKENFEKNDSKVDNTAGGQELKNKDIDFTENVDEDLEKLPPPSKKLNKIDDDDDEEMTSTENPTKYYSALDSTVS